MALVLSVEQVHHGHIVDADGFLRLVDRQEPLGNVLFELHLGFGVVLLGCLWLVEWYCYWVSFFSKGSRCDVVS